MNVASPISKVPKCIIAFAMKGLNTSLFLRKLGPGVADITETGMHLLLSHWDTVPVGWIIVNETIVGIKKKKPFIL